MINTTIRKVSYFIHHPEKLFSKKYVNEYILLAIVIIGIFFRFSNIPGRYVMDFDPTRDALINIVGENEFKFPETGPKSGIASFTFGPLYYYQTIIFSILTPFDYAPWIYIGILSTIAIIVYYFIGKILEDKRMGLIMAALVAITPAELGPTTGLSNPNLIPLQAALALLLFVLFIKKSLSWKWVLVWGLVIGVGINDHFQAIGLLFLPLVAFLVKRQKFLVNIASLGVGLLITFIPLLLFNLNHEWHTIKGFLEYSKSGRVVQEDRWLIFLTNFWPTFMGYVIGVNKILGIAIFLYVGLLGVYAFIKKKLQPIYILLAVIFLLNIVFIRYGTTVRENYYLIYLQGFLFIFFGWAIWFSFKQKYLMLVAIVIIAVVLYFCLKEDIRKLKTEETVTELQHFKSVIQNKYPNEKFLLYSCGDRSRTKVQGLTFVMYHDEILSEQGRKIGIPSDDCTDEFPYVIHMMDKEEGFVELQASQSARIQQYWVKTTPKTVYEMNVEWWKSQ